MFLQKYMLSHFMLAAQYALEAIHQETAESFNEQFQLRCIQEIEKEEFIMILSAGPYIIPVTVYIMSCPNSSAEAFANDILGEQRVRRISDDTKGDTEEEGLFLVLDSQHCFFIADVKLGIQEENNHETDDETTD